MISDAGDQVAFDDGWEFSQALMKDGQLVRQFVHDEIVFEVHPDEADRVTQHVREIMEGVWDLKVPLKVNVCAGNNWAEAH